jgi:hypothetical protein
MMYILSTTIGLHVCGSWHITKQKKWKNNTMPTYKTFFIFLKPINKILLCIYCSRSYKKTHFLNGCSTKNCKILNDFKFSYCTSISFTIKKLITKLHP